MHRKTVEQSVGLLETSMSESARTYFQLLWVWSGLIVVSIYNRGEGNATSLHALRLKLILQIL